jgi:glucose-6-phosphate 1-dehydrogenase
VDHYLGKVGMRAIIDFRRSNMDLLSALNFPSLRSDLPQSLRNNEEGQQEEESCKVTSSSTSNPSAPLVEVVMKEKEHTGGRTVYYDQFGIIRDVMQNHLTQALVYSLMHLHLPSSSSSPSSIDENSKTLLAPETFGLIFPLSFSQSCRAT